MSAMIEFKWNSNMGTNGIGERHSLMLGPYCIAVVKRWSGNRSPASFFSVEMLLPGIFAKSVLHPNAKEAKDQAERLVKRWYEHTGVDLK